MTDLDLGGSLDGWDDELNDWSDAENETTAKLRLDAEFEGDLVRADQCLRVPPFGESCTRGYDHTGPCDWYTATAADRAAARRRAAS